MIAEDNCTGLFNAVCIGDGGSTKLKNFHGWFLVDYWLQIKQVKLKWRTRTIYKYRQKYTCYCMRQVIYLQPY